MTDAENRLQEVASPEEEVPTWKKRLLSWRLAGAILALLVVLGWIFIIIILILEEKWQLVLVAWLLLYSAAHFCYWYCKRHSLITMHGQIRVRVLAHLRNGASGERSDDKPPTYDEVMKTEAPPPAYFTVVSETMKPISPAVSGPAADSKEAVRGSHTSVLEYCEQPPKYHTIAKQPSTLVPAVHGEPMASATAAAISAAAAAVSPLHNASLTEPVEDPIRGPIVRHLRSATMATLEVSSNEEVTNEASIANSCGTSDNSLSSERLPESHGPSLR